MITIAVNMVTIQVNDGDRCSLRMLQETSPLKTTCVSQWKESRYIFPKKLYLTRFENAESRVFALKTNKVKAQLAKLAKLI